MEPTTKQFVTELATTYTDWPMDDPCARLEDCHDCRTRRLCKRVARLPAAPSLHAPGGQPLAALIQEFWLCRHCFFGRSARPR